MTPMEQQLADIISKIVNRMLVLAWIIAALAVLVMILFIKVFLL